MRILMKAQPELEITDKDVRNVAIAGLCHDLGHGPFSHLFDNHFIKALLLKEGNGETWSHEDASIMIFADILDKNESLRKAITVED
jgi:deoxynucleoside triphosphate triphosphohydrolase SAMHD1